MKFDRLKSSIELNKNEEPSIYMACCMIESLIKDIEDASGRRISQTEMGDETLPTKLVWLVREINKIYDKNKDDFQRSREQLDSMMAKLSACEAELSALSVDEAQAAKHKAQERAMLEKLSEAKQRREAYDALVQRCEEMKAEIAGIRDVSLEETGAALRQLTEEKTALAARQAQLEGELSAARQAVAALKSDCDAAEAQTQDARREQALLLAKKEDEEEKAAEMQTQNTGLRAAVAQLEAGNAQQRQAAAQYTQERDRLQERLDAYEKETLLPAQEACRELNGRLEETARQSAALKAACEDAEARLQAAQAAYLALLAQKETEQNNAAKAEQQVAQLQQTVEDLSAQTARQQQSKAAFDEQCESLQGEIEVYERETLLPARESCRELQTRLDAVRQEIAAQTQTLEQKRAEHDAAVLEVSRVRGKIKEEELALQGKQEELTALQEQRVLLDRRQAETREAIGADTQALEQAQEAVRVLEQETLPEVKDFLKREEAHRLLLEDEAAGLETQKAQLTESTEALREKTDALEEALTAARAQHDALTADYEEKNRELTKLRQQVEALEGKNDKRRAREYRQQLENDKAELERAEQECADLEEKIDENRLRLEEMRAQKEALQTEHRQQQKEEREMNALLEKLSPLTDDAYLQQTEKIKNRLSLLRDACDSLSDAVAVMRRGLDLPTVEKLPNPDVLSKTLRRLEQETDMMQKALVTNAQAVKPTTLRS